MTLFKKKNSIPALHYSLDMRVEEMKELGNTSFYYPLKEDEIKQAEAWAMRHRYWMEVSHKNGNILVYKFSGF